MPLQVKKSRKNLYALGQSCRSDLLLESGRKRNGPKKWNTVLEGVEGQMGESRVEKVRSGRSGGITLACGSKR